MAQILYGPYPMSIAQMSAWAKEVSAFDVKQCAKALGYLNHGRITIRRVG